VFQTIQILRGVAATLVAGYHLLLGVRSEGYDWQIGEMLFASGGLGVDIFFVISGFIIYYIAFRSVKPTPMGFLINRFWRVVPPYWVASVLSILLSVALLLILNDASQLSSPTKIIYSLALWPMPPLDYVLPIAWTLSLELMFYLIFAVTALRFNTTVFFVALVIWYVVGLAGVLHANDMSGFAYPAINPIVLEFLFGALIAKFTLSGRTGYHRIAFIAGAIALLYVLLLDVETTGLMRREFLYGIPSAALVYGAIGLRGQWPKVMLLWGESSYLLYLLHVMIFQVFGSLIRLGTGFSVYTTWWSATGLLLIAVGISMALTVIAERRYQAFYKGQMRRFRKAKNDSSS